MGQKQYSFSSELRAAQDTGDNGMILEGKAITFDSPTVLYEIAGVQYKEVINNRALDHTDLSDVVLRYNHTGTFTVLARTRNKSLELIKQPDGLYIRAKLQPDISQHQDVYNAVKAGLVDKMSFGFVAADRGDSYDSKSNTRSINDIRKIFDVSVVDQPAYDETYVEARSRMEQFVDIQAYRESVMIRAQLLKVRLK